MKAITAVFAASILTFQGAAIAQESTPPEQEPERGQGIPATEHQMQTMDDIESDRFAELDKDGDRAISREEAQTESQLADNWSTYDEDGDGTLDMQEFSEFEGTSSSGDEAAGMIGIGETEQEMPATRHQQSSVGDDLVSELDTDGDGAISQDEAEADPQVSGNWDQLDQNADGKLDSQELRDQNQEQQ